MKYSLKTPGQSTVQKHMKIKKSGASVWVFACVFVDVHSHGNCTDHCCLRQAGGTPIEITANRTDSPIQMYIVRTSFSSSYWSDLPTYSIDQLQHIRLQSRETLV